MAQIILGQQKAFLFDIFGWWYGRGVLDFLNFLKAVLIKIVDIFSVRLLLRTFFAPWKRDTASIAGLPLNLMLRVILFNLISRLIGMFIKTIIFLLFVLVALIFIFLAVFLFLVWIFLPLIILAGLIVGIGLIISS